MSPDEDPLAAKSAKETAGTRPPAAGAASPPPAPTAARLWVGRHPLVFTGTVMSLGAVVLLLFVMGLATFVGLANSLAGLLVDSSLVLLFLLGLVFIAFGGWLYRRRHRGEAIRWVIDWSARHD